MKRAVTRGRAFGCAAALLSLGLGVAACVFDPSGVHRDVPDSSVTETCGDGVLDPGEDCDGASLGGASCLTVSGGFVGGTLACDGECRFDTSGCVPSTCGDGVLDPGEDCDGASLGGATCLTVPGGFVDGVLACDGACRFDTSGCVLPVCGDGVLDPGEDCDDGNTVSGDGCADCLVEPGWDCSSGTCLPICGDGLVVGPEECDDSNTTPNDGCSSACTVEDFHGCDGEPSVCSCVVYVNGTGLFASRTGASWLSPLDTVAEGITLAAGRVGENSTCAVWVARGTYGRATAMAMHSRVYVYGGFAGWETAFSQRDVSGNPTILDGQGTADSVVYAEDVTDAVLDGLHIVGGYASGYGGGLWIQGQDIRIEGCVIRDNQAGDDGGGVYVTTESTVIISRSWIYDNNASGLGGGFMSRYQASVVVRDSAIYHNRADAEGGAMAVEEAGTSLQVINTTIVDNTSGNEGGGIYNASATLTVVNAILWGDQPDEIVTSGGETTVSYSLVAGGHPGTGNLQSAPMFKSRATRNYDLLDTSPCVDAGNGDLASAADILHRPRYDAPTTNTGVGTPPYVDMGAFELQP